jgi:hypothetical protein
MTYFKDSELDEEFAWALREAGLMDTVSPERDALIREKAAALNFSPEDTEALVKRINDGTKEIQKINLVLHLTETFRRLGISNKPSRTRDMLIETTALAHGFTNDEITEIITDVNAAFENYHAPAQPGETGPEPGNL